MEFRRAALTAVSAAALLTIVAGCTSGSNGDSTPSATTTVTATDTVSSANPPTGSGVPASSTPPGTGSPGSSGTASGPGLCTPTVMDFTVTPGDGAAGSVYFEIRATNGSQSPCVTTGFPGMALLNAGDMQILQAARDTSAPSATLTVAPGEVISSQVRAVGMGQNGATCPTSPAFLLTLPDNTDSTKIAHSQPACSVVVRPFVKGPGI